MSIAWPTFFAVALLLPGAMFYAGLFSEERIARTTSTSTWSSELIGVVFFAFFLNVIGYGVYVMANCLISEPGGAFQAGSTLSLGPENLVTITALHASDSGYVSPHALAALEKAALPGVVYVLATCILGYALGYIVGKHALDGRYKSIVRSVFVKHEWVYDIYGAVLAARKRKTKDIYAPVSVTVMTDVRMDDQILMYNGFLKDLFVRADGNIAYLVLYGCSRFAIKSADGFCKMTDGSKVKLPNDNSTDNLGNSAPLHATQSRDDVDVFLIEGKEIHNVFFVLSDLSNIDAGMERLDAVLQEFNDA